MNTSEEDVEDVLGSQDLLDADVDAFLQSVVQLESPSGGLLSPQRRLASEAGRSEADEEARSSGGDELTAPTCVADVERLEHEDIGNFKMLWSSAAGAALSVSGLDAADEEESAGRAAAARRRGGLLAPQLVGQLSKTLRSARMRREAGTPKCVATSGQHYAVGTSHGLTLVFDEREQLLVILGSDGASSRGAVCAVDVWATTTTGSDGSGATVVVWVVSGHANGDVVVWDASNGSAVKTIDSAHEQAIVHVKFLRDNRTVLSADASGVCFLFTLSTLLFMWVVNTAKILNGAAGPVYAVQPLPAGAESPLDFLCLVAIATRKRSLIVSLYPRVRILVSLACPLAGAQLPPHTLPCLAWLPAGDEAAAPLLAVAWARRIDCYRVALDSRAPALGGDQPVELSASAAAAGGSYEAGEHVNSVVWIGGGAQAYLLVHTVRDEFRLIDPFRRVELEYFSARALQLVYHTRFAPSATAVPSLCCYAGTFAGTARRLYILGMDGLFSAHVMSWRERIEALETAGRWLDALSLAADFYEQREPIADAASPPLETVRGQLRETMERLLLGYLDSVVTPGSSASELRRLRLIGSVCIDLCPRLRRSDALFGLVFDKFARQGHRGLFLELLEPYVLNGRLRHLPPELMQALVVHYSSSAAMLRRAERCIVQLDIASLDFDQVVRLALQHGLFTALIYLYNRGLEDFVTPLDLLLPDLKRRTAPSAASTLAGYKLLLYLNYCLRGRCYPSAAPLPDRRLPTIKKDVIEWIFARSDGGATPHQRRPHLFALLQFDMREFFDKVMQVIFADAALPVRVLDGGGVQSMADVLLECVVDPHHVAQHQLDGGAGAQLAVDWPFGFEHAVALYSFLAPALARRSVVVPRATLVQIVFLLLSHPLQSAAESLPRQQLIEALIDGHYALLQGEADRLLSCAQAAGFQRVAKLIYVRRGLYEKAVVAQLTDTSGGQLEVFDFVAALVRDPQLSAQKKDDVKTVVLSSLPSLISLSAERTARLIVQAFAQEHAHVLGSLRAFPKLEFQYLRSLLAAGDDPDAAAAAAADSSALSTAEVERYVELMCEFDPLAVHPFLVNHENYRLEKCLAVCRAHKLSDATAYLLERTGDSKGALQLLLLTLETRIARLHAVYHTAHDAYRALFPDADGQVWTAVVDSTFGPEKDVADSIADCCAFCLRHANRLDEAEYEALWFALMDKLVLPLRRLKLRAASLQLAPSLVDDKVKQSLLAAIRNILERMMGHVRLTSILDKIVRDHGADEFGDFKSIILSMLDTYAYEKSILETANQLLQHDAHACMSQLLSARSEAFVPLSSECFKCRLGLTAAPPNLPRRTGQLPLSVFRCGHSFHEACLAESSRCPLCLPDTKLAAGPSGSAPPATRAAEPADLASQRKPKSDVNTCVQRIQRFTNRHDTSKLQQLKLQMSGLR